MPLICIILLQKLASVQTFSVAPLKLPLLSCFLPVRSLLPLLKSHYINCVTDQVGSIIASLHVLGEPSLLVDSVTSGLARSIMRPLEGLMNGDVSEGLEEGVQGFLGGVVGGVSRSVGTIGEAINDYVVEATRDEEWKEVRRCGCEERKTRAGRESDTPWNVLTS